MANRVIRHGNKGTLRCSECECEFIADLKLIKQESDGFNMYYFTNCPDCKNRVNIYENNPVLKAYLQLEDIS